MLMSRISLLRIMTRRVIIAAVKHRSSRIRSISIVLVFGVLGCRSTAPVEAPDGFWQALQPLCGRAFERRVVEGTEPSDAAFASQRLVMHVRSCTDSEIRIPFYVGDDRSRTWVITPTESGLRLKHDHRHEDGTPDRITQYGGDTRVAANRLTLDFFADRYTGDLLPAAAANIWTLSIEPGRRFVYALRREATGRRFRVEFDLTRPVPPPPDPY